MAGMEVLFKMLGETITTGCSNPPDSALYPPRDWVILEKVSEHPVSIPAEDCALGMGPPYTAGKYLCRLAGAGNEKELAFIRIYKQIPSAGTALDNSSVRKAQASEEPGHTELKALKHLTEGKYTATPELLGYRFGKQDAYDLVHGGYIVYLLWKKVEGDSLDLEEFWRLPYNRRQSIRDKFKTTYMEVLGFGYRPRMELSSKIILNKSTDDVYVLHYSLYSIPCNITLMTRIKISGFRWARRIDPVTEWEDEYFAVYSLVLAIPWHVRYLYGLANDPHLDESTGWWW
ncbi:uncharacterized protein N7515_003442 [Penicillium bovifimosum]|uniref:Uncharacterized protein n=1 Tax=Penicillium bovifimosum TaxID=126998 RepID=A0A9W9H4Q6_9EURO|nr:uncharacterized protein N7515_003442 [Penicillium bovifimosum]KAJ5138594.1 hypothetical protein N7515_003442 [Penicillium bovifimosum]